MISKILSGKSFGGLCRYLYQDQSRAVVLEALGVRDYDHKLMAADFEEQRQLNPDLKKPVLHAILSYYPGEKITDEKMKQIGKEYLKELGIQNTQVVIVRHTDRKHEHVHIVVNRVDNDGKTIKDNWIGLRGKKVAQQLTLKHELVQAQKKNLELTHLEKLNEYQVNRYKVYQTITNELPKCKTLTELEQKLTRHGIETLYKYKGQTKELQGVSFQVGKYKYKGSEVDREFSIKNLEKSLARNFVLKQENRQHRPLNERQQKTLSQMLEMSQSKGKNLLEELMRPEHINDNVPYELMKKKRKQKRQSHHL